MTQERFLDQFLGDPAGEASRGDALTALRHHVLGPVIIEIENPDGATAEHFQGHLVEASRDPGTRETAELFAVVTAPAANAWHLRRDFLEELAGTREHVAREMREADEEPLFTFGVPATGIIQYLGPDAGSAGYRWPLDGGQALAVVLWQDVLHVTDSGDVAPGMGGFRAAPEEHS
jgi:hypothetical protein